MKNNRYKESVAPIIHTKKQADINYQTKILYSPCDQGVIRNNGRNGSRFAPKAILNLLKKQNNHLGYIENEAILTVNVFDDKKNGIDFNKLQDNSSRLIHNEINETPLEQIIHIGGGHDHIYPLLMAIDKTKRYKNIFIINIDAHCDTRIDSEQHSGTPFRDFDSKGTKPYHLVQYGVHEHANSSSTLSSLNRGSEKKIFFRQLRQLTSNQTTVPKELYKDCPFEIDKDTAIILSLDCDGIDGSQMQAVSCVNTLGVNLQHILDLISDVKKYSKNQLVFGVYEFNPVFDNLSLYGCKSIVHLLYEFLKK
jgi:formiminoglutamase